jgi:CheY-like chemotaxis protein
VDKKNRVLVVDDYPGARYRRMRLLLDDGRFEVAEESMGREALRRLTEERFDAVIIDIHLPDVSGLDVCRSLRQDPRLAHLPILAVSAVADRFDAERAARDAGASAFIADEEDGEAFVAAVARLLQGPATT